VDERRRLIEDVDKDRRHTIDTTIIRIMKSRKVLGHEHLVMECVEQLGHLFKVSLSLSLSVYLSSFCMMVLNMKNAKICPWKLFFFKYFSGGGIPISVSNLDAIF
jgi:hypothetical protein